MKKSLSLLLLLMILSLASCTTYRCGMADKENYPGIRAVVIVNRSREGDLSRKLKQSIYQQISTRPGLKKKPTEKAVTITVKVIALEENGLISAERRNKNARVDDSDAYQTVLFRLTLHVQCTVTNPDGSIVLQENLTGVGDAPRMHDHQIGIENAKKLAASDVANKIAAALNDASWKKTIVTEQKK